MSEELSFRFVTPADAQELLDIYAPYVTDTVITFEYEVPSVEEFRSRILETQKKYPYIAAIKDGQMIGYSYVGSFVGRAAYDWSVETTIYLRQDQRGKGYGRRLYEVMESVLKEMHILNLNACIGYPEVEDDYLTKNSASFHAHLGYSMVGEFHQCGYKFGRWYNMVWMEKIIGEHADEPQPVRNVNEIRDLLREKYGIL